MALDETAMTDVTQWKSTTSLISNFYFFRWVQIYFVNINKIPKILAHMRVQNIIDSNANYLAAEANKLTIIDYNRKMFLVNIFTRNH